MSPAPLLVVEHLSIGFPARRRGEPAPRPCTDVSLSVESGQVVGLVGASGSGKTMTALAVCGLLPPGGHVLGGSIRLGNEELGTARPRRWRELRGREIGLVFQDAGRALDPVHTVEKHLREAAGSKCDAGAMLERVGLDRSLVSRYPHQLSGGQRQRVMIAVATARRPGLVLADEPTSSVDAITQVHVLRELLRAQRELGCGLIIISHDLGVISRVADEVVVLDGGRVVERGTTRRILMEPEHPITQELMATRAAGSPAPKSAAQDTGALALMNVSKRYGHASGPPAVAEVSLHLRPGETLALVGESGSGKSTVARMAALLLPPSKGSVMVDDVDPRSLSGRARRRLRLDVQLAHQDVAAALDPRQRISNIIAEPLRNRRVPRAERTRRVKAVLAAVDLADDLLDRRPAQLSGGQRQRVGLARTLVPEPRYLLLDEPVSALDASLVAGSVDLLRRLQDERGHGCLVISHDLTVVGSLAHRLAVMYAGEIVETGPTAAVLAHPLHPYTQALAASTLLPDVDAGLPETGALNPPSADGCAYSTRCPNVVDQCRESSPPLRLNGGETSVRCWLVGPVASLDGG